MIGRVVVWACLFLFVFFVVCVFGCLGGWLVVWLVWGVRGVCI